MNFAEIAAAGRWTMIESPFLFVRERTDKAIVRIEFTAEQPPTFWNSNRPCEYDFLANVDPNVAHPRWSQSSD
jgi:hypothetical protein